MNRNKTNKQNEAYQELVNLCKLHFPTITRDPVVKKIQSLHGSFRKKKVNCNCCRDEPVTRYFEVVVSRDFGENDSRSSVLLSDNMGDFLQQLVK